MPYVFIYTTVDDLRTVDKTHYVFAIVNVHSNKKRPCQSFAADWVAVSPTLNDLINGSPPNAIGPKEARCQQSVGTAQYRANSTYCFPIRISYSIIMSLIRGENNSAE